MQVLEEFDKECPLTTSFCKLISTAEFDEQSIAYTEQALRELYKTMDQSPRLYERVVRKRKQRELEKASIASFIEAKFFSTVQGHLNRCNAMGGAELKQRIEQLKAEMQKVCSYSREAKCMRTSRSERMNSGCSSQCSTPSSCQSIISNPHHPPPIAPCLPKPPTFIFQPLTPSSFPAAAPFQPLTVFSACVTPAPASILPTLTFSPVPSSCANSYPSEPVPPAATPSFLSVQVNSSSEPPTGSPLSNHNLPNFPPATNACTLSPSSLTAASVPASAGFGPAIVTTGPHASHPDPITPSHIPLTTPVPATNACTLSPSSLTAASVPVPVAFGPAIVTPGPPASHPDPITPFHIPLTTPVPATNACVLSPLSLTTASVPVSAAFVPAIVTPLPPASHPDPITPSHVPALNSAPPGPESLSSVAPTAHLCISATSPLLASSSALSTSHQDAVTPSALARPHIHPDVNTPLSMSVLPSSHHDPGVQCASFSDSVSAPSVCAPPPAPPLPPTAPPLLSTLCRNQTISRQMLGTATPELLTSYGLGKLNSASLLNQSPSTPLSGCSRDPISSLQLELQAGNHMNRLRRTGLARSPGGTPVMDASTTKTPSVTFNTSLLNKFQNVNSPETSNSDGENSGFETPSGSPTGLL